MCVVDAEYDPKRFFFRMIGSDIVDLYGGIDNSGKYLDDLKDELGEAYEEVEAIYTMVTEAKQIVRYDTSFDWVGRGHIKTVSFNVPLVDDAGVVVRFVGIVLHNT